MTRSTEATDSDLVRDARAGQAAAFEALTRRHFPMVFAIAYARLASREAAEDLAQEAFLRAYLHLDALTDPARFAAWLSRIARNEATSWLRQSQSASRLVRLVPLDDLPTEPADPAARQARAALESDEETRALRQALFELPADQRELVMLHYFEGLNNAEIAERLDVHRATVGRQLEKALKTMKRSLEPILRRAAPAFRHSGGAAARTLAVVGAIAALSTEAKAVLLAETAGAVALATAVSLPSAAATGGAAGGHATYTGGLLLTVNKALAAAAVVLAIAAGTVYLRAPANAPAPAKGAATSTPSFSSAADSVARVASPVTAPPPRSAPSASALATASANTAVSDAQLLTSAVATPAALTSATAVLPADVPRFTETNEANRRQMRTAKVTYLHLWGEYPDPNEERRNVKLQAITEQYAAKLKSVQEDQTRPLREVEMLKTQVAGFLAKDKERLTEPREFEMRKVYYLDSESGKCRLESSPTEKHPEPEKTPPGGISSFEMHTVAIFDADGSGGTYYPRMKQILVAPSLGGKTPATPELPCTGTLGSWDSFDRWSETGCHGAVLDGRQVVVYEFASTQPGNKSRMIVYADPALGFRYRRVEFRYGNGDTSWEVRQAGEYRIVNGVPIPFYYEDTHYFPGGDESAVERREVVRVETAMVNAPLPDDAFQFEVDPETKINDKNLTRMFKLPDDHGPVKPADVRELSRAEQLKQMIEQRRSDLAAAARATSATEPVAAPDAPAPPAP